MNNSELKTCLAHIRIHFRTLVWASNRVAPGDWTAVLPPGDGWGSLSTVPSFVGLNLGPVLISKVPMHEACYIEEMKRWMPGTSQAIIEIIAELEPFLDQEGIFTKMARKILIGICDKMGVNTKSIASDPLSLRPGTVTLNMDGVERVNFGT